MRELFEGRKGTSVLPTVGSLVYPPGKLLLVTSKVEMILGMKRAGMSFLSRSSQLIQQKNL